jgi:dynein heavy chain
VYEYSLDFYIDIFEKSLESAPPGRYERIKNINSHFCIKLFESITKSLLSKDKLIFSIILCFKILLYEKKQMTLSELRFLMIGGTAITPKKKNPAPDWVSDKQWAILEEISATLPSYKKFDEEFPQFLTEWKQVFHSENPALG